MFHINDIYNYNICKHLYHKNQDSERLPYHNYVQMDETLSIIVARKLDLKNGFFGQTNDTTAKTLAAMQENQWLIKARFEFNDLRIKIPFMHKVNDKWDIYFIRNELFPKEDSLQYMADNVWLLKQLNIDYNNILVVHFNQDYIREDEIDYQKLMVVSHHLYNHNNQPTINITEKIASKMRDLSPTLLAMRSFDATKLNKPKREKKCIRRVKCRFYDECFVEQKDVTNNSILTLTASENKYKMYEEGRHFLAQVDVDKIEGTRVQYAQIMADINKGLFVDKANLNLWLKDNIQYPLSFLDFEWDRYAIPPYKNMKPFDVVLFQYSLHIYDQKLTHSEYIGIEDCRYELLTRLLADLPKTGSIIVFNASGGEELRLRELQAYYPQHHDEIEAIIKRIVDFSIPFNLGMVYHVDMAGSYSLKKIIEAIDGNLSYQNLGISQAMNAVDGWRRLNNGNIKTDEKLVDDLLAYCAMDTFSLYLIYQWFLKIGAIKE